VPDSVVKKQIREELPDESEVDDVGRHHAKPIGEESLGGGPPDELRDFLDEEYGDADDAERFDSAGEILAEVEAVAVAAGKGAHGESLRSCPYGVKGTLDRVTGRGKVIHPRPWEVANLSVLNPSRR
jgi:hypothetical protein